MTWTDVAIPALTRNPDNFDAGIPVRLTPNVSWRNSFASVIASGVDTEFWTLVCTGAGQGVSQSGGNLVMTTGTTVNSESIIRSKVSWQDPFIFRYMTMLSQRIANQSFFVELVDVIGDALAITISSATAVTVTIPNNPFTAANVGQSVYLGNYSGTGTFVPGRYAIASVTGNNVTFTVSGFSTGAGTVSVFGWNYHHFLYDGTTATTTKYDAQRRGWASGDTSMSMNTSASPGHIGQLFVDDSHAFVSDSLAASTTGYRWSARADRVMNLPGYDFPLYLQIRAVNGSSAPASTTTLTIGFVSMEEYVATPVIVNKIKDAGGYGNQQVFVSGTVTNSPTRPTTYSYTTTASTNATLISSTTTRVLTDIVISNPTATAAYVKLFVKTTAPTVGTDNPVIIIPVPANSTVQQAYPYGRVFAGLGFAVTGAIGPLDTSNTVAGVLISASFY